MTGQPNVHESSQASILREELQLEPINEAIITAGMPLSEVLMHLSRHGCEDITLKLDESKCSEHALSNGGFGDIFRGALRDGTRVGIKRLRLQLNSAGDKEKQLKHAARELYIWSKCEHPNILPLIGMTQFRNQISMVSPWMEHGTLSNFLSRRPQLNRCTMCVQIAEGVSYLHAQGIVHGDIKGSNILISHDFVPKLTDFGNSWFNETTQSLQFSETTSDPSMTARWAAPEVVEGDIKSSVEADVYALGMTILEIISGSVPYENLLNVAVIRKVIAGVHPERPQSHIPLGIGQADLLWKLLTDCWNINPTHRPTASKARDEMKGITPEGLMGVTS
ncbi:unnamed protein product [Rhizoctonia solani]|uniref:Protein kinase domain-containing protein n=1 Tax=Rhizoctonia solani TaxID=456999 RepID=A0A8H2W8K2_9AGAM|nr:unnamed protein product [Rhizoctonia solani]